ncbi:hypothetical protein SprV_0301184500 [Sparganum proliferum]
MDSTYSPNLVMFLMHHATTGLLADGILAKRRLNTRNLQNDIRTRRNLCTTTMSQDLNATSAQKDPTLSKARLESVADPEQTLTGNVDNAEVRCCAEDAVVEALANVLSELPSHMFESIVKSSSITFLPFG